MMHEKLPEPENPFQPVEGDIHVHAVWLTADDATVGRSRALLSGAELQRADRFAFDALRRRHTIAHAALRLLLARYLVSRTDEIQFRPGPRGKPELEGDSEFRFNLAHSGELAVYAFARRCEVGVDVEEIRAMPGLEPIASSYFCPAEAAELLSFTAGKERLEAFFRCWTRKEAYVKAVGEGLWMPLDRFQVTMSCSDPAGFVHIGHDRTETEAWRLHHLAPAPNYFGALAYRAGPQTVMAFSPVEIAELLPAAIPYAG